MGQVFVRSQDVCMTFYIVTDTTHKVVAVLLWGFYAVEASS
jgi:hypothetical protein